MGIFVRANATSFTAANSRVVRLTRPTGVVKGDLMIAAVYARGAGGIQAEKAWKFIRDDAVGGAGAHVSLYWRVAGGRRSRWDWTIADSSGDGVLAAGYVGAATWSAIDVSAVSAGNGLALTAPHLSTTVDQDWALVIFAAVDGGAGFDFSTPPGWTPRVSTGPGATNPVAVFERGPLTPGPIVLARSTATLNTGGWVAQTIAVKPSGGRTIDDGVKKAFDFAADLTKQLMTLATAILALIITFSKDFLAPSSPTPSGNLGSIVIPPDVKDWLIKSLAAFVISIFLGIIAYGQFTRVLQEDDVPTVNDASTQICAVLQWIAFLTGLVFGGIYVWNVAGLVSQAATPPAPPPVATSFTVRGTVWFDRNENGKRDPGEPLLAGIPIRLEQDGRPGVIPTSGADGSYELPALAPGTLTLRADLPETGGLGMSSPIRVVQVDRDLADQDLGLVLPPSPRDDRYFPQTGYRIDNDRIWDYFRSRGGVDTFGFPVTRAFPLVNLWTQVFQRRVLQVQGSSAVPMNILEPGLMPRPRLDSLTLPEHDAVVAAAAPSITDAEYGFLTLEYLRTSVPDTWEGEPVRFHQAYFESVSPGAARPEPLAALEIWGMPTSRPARDPNNARFVYQRFQRGYMHYDASSGQTRGLLLGDAFRALLLGQDDSTENATSVFAGIYDPAQVNAVAAGKALGENAGETILAFAFTPD